MKKRGKNRQKNESADVKMADRWACDGRTLRRWRKAGAPLTDQKAMRTWLATRKHIPAGTAALLEATRTSERATSAAQDGKQAEGAANALRRLEQAEARAYTDFKQATASGDEIRIKASRENWLKISESLRRFDLAIEQARRDSGDLVPRDDLRRMAYQLQQAFWFGFLSMESACPSLTGLSTPNEVWTVLSRLRDTVHSAILSSLQSEQKPPVPPWLIKAVTLGEFPVDAAKVEQRYVEYWAALSQVTRAVAVDARAQLDQKISAFAAQKAQPLSTSVNASPVVEQTIGAATIQ
jgi:hypothetical protein